MSASKQHACKVYTPAAAADADADATRGVGSVPPPQKGGSPTPKTFLTKVLTGMNNPC